MIEDYCFCPHAVTLQVTDLLLLNSFFGKMKSVQVSRHVLGGSPDSTLDRHPLFLLAEESPLRTAFCSSAPSAIVIFLASAGASM